MCRGQQGPQLLTAVPSPLPPAELTAAHFGGGGLLHKNTVQQQDEGGEKPRSRKELIEELIAKSKQDKVHWSHCGHGVAPQAMLARPLPVHVEAASYVTVVKALVFNRSILDFTKRIFLRVHWGFGVLLVGWFQYFDVLGLAEHQPLFTSTEQLQQEISTI